jgi:2-oxoglutarate dehydrogenase E1 component
LHLSLTPNPSHLEAVDPVVEGRVRAKQDRAGDRDHATCVPVLLHGDAAFAGQGLVTEVLNLSELDGYRTGGTIHIVVNNQIGFTTAPVESRSTPYATDIARMLAVPIFHVNGEDAEAVAAVTRLAMQWRHAFKRDVVIDMYCFRKHGHNEGDEPSFTQPLMYDLIRSRATPRDICARQFVEAGAVSEKEAEAIRDESRRALEAEGDDPAAPGAVFESPLKEMWAQHLGGSIFEAIDTGWSPDRLRALYAQLNTPPAGFAVHPKAARVLRERLELVASGQVDWALGEQAAYATVLAEGHRVRLSGQDSGRGTFSHRHAVLTDVKTAAEYFPLKNIHAEQGAFDVIDSSLSEAGVLGFEFGYSWDAPDALVLWEAQFGDFVNGAQVIIDQYLVAAEQKWGRLSGLVLLLPHGYEGQGPEHSSARLERFLQLCAEDNLQVANCTTPANFFHLLRQQVKRQVRKPLVVMTPKGFLRTAKSSLEDMASGTFRPVLADPRKPSAAKRVVLCSGKVYYDLEDARAKAGVEEVALVRVERLYPFPATEIAAILEQYPGAEVVWCQEEPRNMGAWPMFLHWFSEALPNRMPRYVGRPSSASPATGSHKAHGREQSRLVSEAISL